MGRCPPTARGHDEFSPARVIGLAAFVALISLAGAIIQAVGFLERLAAFLHGEVDQAECAQAVDKADAGELIDETGRQQDQRHVNANFGAARVGDDGLRV